MGGAPDSTSQAGEPSWRLVLRNDLAAVGKANESLEEFLRKRGIEPEAVYSAGLALEEVATNVIKYGYDDDREHEIHVEVRLSPEELLLRVSDDGHEYDPLRAPPPDLDASIEDRPIGGLGIHLLRNLAQRLSYERVRGNNVLTLHFDLKPKA